MKKIALLLALSSLSLGAVACGGSSSSTPSSTAPSSSGPPPLPTKVPGQLTVAIEPYGPPFQIGSATNPTGGYEIDMIREIAKRLGIKKIVWERVPFGKVITSASTSNWDFDADEFSITAARAKVIDFSSPYFLATEGVLVKKGTQAASITSLAQLKTLRLGGQSGTTGIYTIQDLIKPAAKPSEFPSTGAANLAVLAGRIDAEVNDLPILLDAVTKSPELAVVGQIATGDKYGLVFPKGSALAAKVDAVISQMQADGTLVALATKYKLNSSDVPVLN